LAKRSNAMYVIQIVVAVLAAPLMIAVGAVILLLVVPWWLVWGSILRVWFWLAHRRHGRFILLVYSESPNWQSYIEHHILSRVSEHAFVLNWSRRKQWNRESWWAARAFDHWAGSRAFNPIALVFIGPWRVTAIRFYHAFRDFKHGKEHSLRNAEAELFRHVPDAAV
jgi:hypothetical protein